MLESQIDAIRFIIALPFFLYASYQDYKERLIDNRIWFYLGIIAIILDVVYFYELGLMLIFLLPSVIVFYEWFFEWDNPVPIIVLYVLSFLIGAYPIFIPALLGRVYPLLMVFVIMIIIRLLHRMKVIRGRADARALMTVALLQPLYPRIPPFPLFIPKYLIIVEITFPFVFLVLLYASIASFFYMLSLLVLNIVRGDIGFPEMFLGYRINVEEVNKRHVWLMERMENGEPVLYIHPKEHTKEDVEKLRKCGREKVWVQPQIPFVIFITVGLVLSYLIGNFI